MKSSVAAFAGLGLCLFGNSLAAQTEPPRVSAIRGVVQTEKGEPIEGARVELKGAGLSAMTRADGSFRLADIKPGRYWITASRSGLDPRRVAVTLEPAQERSLEFHLSPLPPSLSEARTVELDSLYREFAERLESSLDGVFLTRDDIERSRQPQLGAVLAHYLVQTSPRSAVRSGSSCAPYESWSSQQVTRGSRLPSEWQAYPYISVNGARPFRGRALYEFDPGDVVAVEFYRGAGPSFGYIPTSTQCGLAIVWTK